MVSFRLEPFLWIHLVGIAVVPIACGVVLCGLAMGTPFAPWLELLLLVLMAWLPIVAMQWFRPFEIFSLLLIALRPGSLSDSRRQILSLFKRPRQRGVTLVVAGLSLILLWTLYYFAPIAYSIKLPLPQVRLLGLLVAIIAYFAVNLFLQVPLSVLGVLLTSRQTFQSTPAIASEAIAKNFTIPGVKVRQMPLIPNYSEPYQ